MVGLFNSCLGVAGSGGKLKQNIGPWTRSHPKKEVVGLDPKRIEGLFKICFMVIVIKV
jgi:hypothetical protein